MEETRLSGTNRPRLPDSAVGLQVLASSSGFNRLKLWRTNRAHRRWASCESSLGASCVATRGSDLLLWLMDGAHKQIAHSTTRPFFRSGSGFGCPGELSVNAANKPGAGRGRCEPTSGLPTNREFAGTEEKFCWRNTYQSDSISKY
jgi:hypothetical protein